MNSTFYHTGQYVCKCGREFNNSQSFNAHKAHCSVIYLEKYGNLDALHEKDKRAGVNSGITQAKKAADKKQKKLEQWISEQHLCEKCGKIMTEKFGSGRFCSRACANSRTQTDEIKAKIGAGVKRYNEANPEEAHQNAIKRATVSNSVRKKAAPEKEKEVKLKLNDFKSSLNIPIVKDEVQTRKSGWQSRSIKNSYPEQFWMKVFDNNNINYIREYLVHCEHKGATYKLDFLINDIYDIEIDGSQHLEEDVKSKDIRRDKYLTSLGYKVIRVPWINPTTKEKCNLVKSQIDSILNELTR